MSSYREACAVYEELKDAFDHAECLYDIGRIHYDRGEIDAGLETTARSLTLAEQIDSIELQIKNYSLQGLLSLAKKEFQPALTASQQALQLLSDETLLEHPHRIYFNHSLILESLGRIAEAKTFLGKAVRIVQERAKGLRDEKLRSSFLINVPLNANIFKIWQRHSQL